MKKTLLLLTSVLFSYFLSAQHWAEIKADPDATFFEKQAAFEAYWDGKDYEKGKGYKQFKRWEWYWGPRVDENGNFPSPTHVWDEVAQFEEARKSRGLSQMKTNANWQPVGPFEFTTGPDLGRVSCMAEDPSNADILYAGTPGGGLWKSTNAGSSWNPMTDHLPTLGVSGVVVDPVNTDIVYIATGDGDADDTYSVGVLKSLDGGVTWETTGLAWQVQNLRTCHKLIMSPVDNMTLFVATSVGLFRTENGGDSWSAVHGGEIRDVEFHPTNPEIMYACDASLFKSTNGGSLFTSIQSEIPSANTGISRMCIAVSADEPDWLYVLTGRADNEGYRGLYRSTNLGESFTTRSTSPNIMGWSDDGSDSGGQAWYDIALAVDPGDASRVFVGGVNLWRSTSGGSSWGIRAHWVNGVTSNYVHADIHQLEYVGNKLYCMSDGGISMSPNNGGSFINISNGIVNTQYYKIGVSQSNANMMLAGAQDNGTHRKLNSTWSKTNGGDGMECVVHPENSNIYYVSSQYGNIRRTTNGGFDFDNWVWGIPETGGWVTPYMLDPNDLNTLYVGYQSLWKRTGSGPWQQIGNFNSNIDDFNIAPTNSNVIYVGRGSSLRKTVDGGDNWTTVDLPNSSLEITDIAFNPDNDDQVFVTVSGYSADQKVFRTLDGGETWENLSLNLPNIPANAVVYEPGSNGGLYLGMDVGVYYTNDDLASWIPFDSDLPRVMVSELEFQVETGKLRAATYGRGVWETGLFTVLDQLPEADFVANNQVICEGEEVTFYDMSTYHESGWNWEMTGAEPSTSELASPTATYPTAGSYEVSLSVSNTLGADDEVKTNYINVIPQIGEPLPFSEDFESFETVIDTDDWFVINEEADAITWRVNNEHGYNSPSCVWVDNYNNTEDYEDRLFTTTLDLSGVSEVVLSMDVASAQRFDSDKDKLKVYVSSNCGNNYSLKKSFSAHTTLSSVEPMAEPFFPSSPDDWHNLEVTSINEPFFVEGFRLQLYFESDGGNNIFVDNINLLAVPVGLNDVELSNLNLAINPNPSQGDAELSYFLLGDRDVSYTLSDMTGRIIRTIDLGNNGFGDQKVRLDADGLSSGIYVVTLHLEGKKQQVKWSIN